MASKKKPGSALVKWDQKLAELAERTAKTVENVGTGGNMIKTQGGNLNYQGADIPKNTMRVIVLAHRLHNAWYENQFDPSAPESPACYAFGEVLEGMAPHEKSEKPQNDACAGCPQNDWGTANTGRGKACANKCRLALVSETDLGEDISQAEIAYIHVPVTSVKGWAGFVRSLKEIKLPPLAVIMELRTVPDAKSQFKMLFETIEKIEDGETLEALFAKAEIAEREIEFPYPEFVEQPQPARRGAKGRNVVLPRTPPAAKGKAAAGKSKFAR